jgi:uncharacterized protein
MKKIMWFGLFLGTLSLVLNACSSPGSVGRIEEQIVVRVTGEGEVFVAPDIGYINIGVRSKGNTVSEAIASNNELAKSIQASLLEQDVEEKDIQTSNFNVYQQSDYDFNGNPTNIYYSVENTVNVTVRQIDKMGAILDAAARGGANNIYGVYFDVQDKSEALSTARLMAVQSAQAQALELAAAAGEELGKLISIDSSTTSPEPNYGYGMGGGGGMAESVPIASGQITVSAQVHLTFAIK